MAFWHSSSHALPLYITGAEENWFYGCLKFESGKCRSFVRPGARILRTAEYAMARARAPDFHGGCARALVGTPGAGHTNLLSWVAPSNSQRHPRPVVSVADHFRADAL